MLDKIRNKTRIVLRLVTSSIAFYPTLIFCSFLLLAFVILSIEDNKMTHFLLDNAPYLVINNADTARSILSTLIGGLISLMVFSFSMVMVLLNQASSNFSPRLLPGLISDKRNQVVLGTYLGTILYNILVLISILPDGDKYTLNGFSVLLGIVLGMMCLVFFIFFVHGISTNIQINNILDNIYKDSKNRLEVLINKEREEAEPIFKTDSGWHTILAHNAGYYQGINLKRLKGYADEHKLNIKIFPYVGEYILPNKLIAKVDRQISDEEKESFKSHLIYSTNIDINENYVLGFKQITEVGVKAMSPGINDPGTALLTLDYLTELFALRMQISDKEIYKSKNEDYTIDVRVIDFSNLIYQSLASYRQYCKHDVILMEKLANLLCYLIQQPSKRDQYYEVITHQAKVLREDFNSNITNSEDRNKIDQILLVHFPR